MIDTSRRGATLLLSVVASTVMIASPAFSQGPTDAQRAAIKSQCRSDYIAHCSSITPGGAAALQCLQKNMASLSGGCQSAVRAVEASVEKSEPKADIKGDAKTETTTESKPDAKPEATPTAATAKPAAEPAATATKPSEPAAAPAAKSTATATTAAKPAASAMPNKPSDAQIAAVRSSCRSDYPKVCAGVPTGGAPALRCLEKNKSKLSAGCAQAVAAAGGGAAAPTAAAASGTEATATPGTATATPGTAAASSGMAAAPPLVLRPMRPREVLFVMRSACGADVRALCAGVDPGGGRIIECLATQSASLSPDCRSVLGQFAAR
jgi:hypothetical protein